MSFTQKAALVANAKAEMDSSKMVALNDAVYLFQANRDDEANKRLENAAQYAWGFNRPKGWNT